MLLAIVVLNYVVVLLFMFVLFGLVGFGGLVFVCLR